MNKRVRVCTAVLLVMLLLMPMQANRMPVLAKQEGSEKISSYLQERMAGFDGPFPVYVFGYVPEESLDIMLPFNPPKKQTWEEIWNKEPFAEYAANFQKELGLEQNLPVLDVEYLYAMSYSRKKHGSCALAAVWLTKEEIYRVASDEQVEKLLGVCEPGKSYPPFDLDSCDSLQALRILQVSVGLLETNDLEAGPLPSRYYNINRDDYVNALDALLALQESVGLIAIGEPVYWEPIHEGIMEIWGSGYDWERERMYNPFLCAGDENGDGVADEIDILLKCRDLWN